MLRERNTGGGIYEDEARVEIEECIHLHYRDLRLTFNKQDFLALGDMLAEAMETYEAIGEPATTERMMLLARTRKLTPGIAKNRLGIEYQHDDTVHVHYKDLRIHLKPADFMYHAGTFRGAAPAMPRGLVEEVEIWPPSTAIQYHPIVDKYVDDLDDAVPPSRPLVDVINEIEDERWGHEFHHRNMGFPDGVPRPTSEELDKEYLFAVHDSIKKHGYAKGPYANEYIVAYNTGSGLYLTGSHRLASLLKLGYKKIEVLVVEPESGWQ